jgi:CDP-diacylglycerol--serine O-phosphatidyltransferase
LTWNGRIGGQLPFGVVEILDFRFHPLALMYLVSGSAMVSKTLHVPKP